MNFLPVVWLDYSIHVAKGPLSIGFKHLKRGVTCHHDLVGERNFHRGLLKRDRGFRMRMEVDLVGGEKGCVLIMPSFQ
jgi:hypothetical protein